MFDMAGYRRGQKIRSGDVYRLLVFARTCASGLGSAFRCCARSSGASHPSPEAAFRCSETCRPDGVRRQWEERSRSVLFEECDSEFMAFGQNLDVEEHTRTCFDLSIGWSFPRTALFSCALSPPCRRDEPCPARNFAKAILIRGCQKYKYLDTYQEAFLLRSGTSAARRVQEFLTGLAQR